MSINPENKYRLKVVFLFFITNGDFTKLWQSTPYTFGFRKLKRKITKTLTLMQDETETPGSLH